MSIIVYVGPYGGRHQGYPIPHTLADLICAAQRAKFLPGGWKIAYRVRCTLKQRD